jgi:hypothetical protein
MFDDDGARCNKSLMSSGKGGQRNICRPCRNDNSGSANVEMLLLVI